jgi:RNA polymerase sigma factor (TIGR02999 family)
MNGVTELLEATRRGDKAAEAALFALVYDDLRRLARRHLHSGMPARLQTTSLVNETYLRLAGSQGLPYRDRGHLFAVASRAMRQIAVDHARAAMTLKRGGDQGAAITLEDHLAADDTQERPEQILALDQALERLAAFNPRMAQLVELRFFGGFELEEIEPMLEVTTRTLKRDWRIARAFLYDALSDESA